MASRRESRRRAAKVLVAGCLSVAFLLPLSPAAGSERVVKPQDGVYKGRSAQGHPVKLKVRRGVVLANVLFTISGSGGCKTTAYYLTAAKVASNGTFKLRSSLVSVRVNGRFVTSTTVRGTLSDPECSSAPKSVAWSARRAS